LLLKSWAPSKRGLFDLMLDVLLHAPSRLYFLSVR
jgi:hypothetical protein